MADRQQRLGFTENANFVDSRLLYSRPAKRLLISAGNLTNAQPQAWLLPAVPMFVGGLQTNDFVELAWSDVIVRS